MRPLLPRGLRQALVLLATSVAALSAATVSDPASRWLLLDAAKVGSRVIAVGERGAVLGSSDSGQSWQRLNTPAAATLTGITVDASGRQVWACGHDASLLRSLDGGTTWSAVQPEVLRESSFLDIQFVGEKQLLAAGAFGALALSADDGATWSLLPHPGGDLHLNQILPLPGGRVLVCGEGGLLLLSPDSGRTWNQLQAPYEGSFFGALSLPDGRVLIHGLRGHVFIGTFSGDEPVWVEGSVPRPALLSSALRLPDGSIVVAGQARNFMISRDEGRSFTAWASGLTTAVAALLTAPDGTTLAFGEGGASRLSPPKSP